MYCLWAFLKRYAPLLYDLDYGATVTIALAGEFVFCSPWHTPPVKGLTHVLCVRAQPHRSISQARLRWRVMFFAACALFLFLVGQSGFGRF